MMGEGGTPARGGSPSAATLRLKEDGIDRTCDGTFL